MCYKAQENELVILYSTTITLGSTQVDLMLHNSCQRGFGMTLLWFRYMGKRFPKARVIVGSSPGWVQGASGCREVGSLRALPLEGLATIVVRLQFPQKWVVMKGQEWPFISPVPDIVCFDIVHRDRIPPRGIAMETSALRANQTTLLQE